MIVQRRCEGSPGKLACVLVEDGVVAWTSFSEAGSGSDLESLVKELGADADALEWFDLGEASAMGSVVDSNRAATARLRDLFDHMLEKGMTVLEEEEEGDDD